MMKKLKLISTILDVISFTVLISIIIFFTGYYQKLPDRVILNLGQVNMIWGSKHYFIALLWMSILSYGMFFILSRFPELTPYPVKITPHNFIQQRWLSKIFASICCCIVMLIYFMIILLLYFRANHITGDYGIYIYIVFALFGLLIADIVIYIIVARRAERRGKH